MCLSHPASSWPSRNDAGFFRDVTNEPFCDLFAWIDVRLREVLAVAHIRTLPLKIVQRSTGMAGADKASCRRTTGRMTVSRGRDRGPEGIEKVPDLFAVHELFLFEEGLQLHQLGRRSLRQRERP